LLSLKAPKTDGSYADVTLLRPVDWVAKCGAKPGATVEIHVPECGIDGRAEVLAVGPCPAVDRGEGRVVTGTYHHHVARTFDVFLKGSGNPIGVTGNHPFWSEDRQAFVRADSLKPGEHLKTFAGSIQVAAIVPPRGSGRCLQPGSAIRPRLPRGRRCGAGT
jgi:hypothetical protein